MADHADPGALDGGGDPQARQEVTLALIAINAQIIAVTLKFGSCLLSSIR